MRTEISEIIIRVHQNLTGVRLSGADIDFLLHTSRRCDVLFVFISGAAEPLYIIKLSRDAENKARLVNEAAALKFLDSRACYPLKGTVPVALFEGVVQDHFLIVETFLKGISLNEKLFACRNSKKALAQIFSSVTDWSIALHAGTSSSRRMLAEFLDSGFWAQSLDTYKSTNPQGLSREYEKQINARLDIFRGLPDCVIRPVFGHNDFSPYNILYDPGANSVRVIDWANASHNAAPLSGLLNFFVVSRSVLRGFEVTRRAKVYFSFSRNVHNVMPDENDVLDLFYRPAWFNELVKQNIDRYIGALGLDKRLLPLLFLLFLLRHMNHSRGALELFLQKEKGFLL